MEIEPGCLAIIINSEAGNDGICVTVGKFLGKVLGWRTGSRWEVNKPMNTTLGNTVCHVEERQLMRIDNFQGDETLEREATLDRPALTPSR